MHTRSGQNAADVAVAADDVAVFALVAALVVDGDDDDDDDIMNV